MPTGNVSILVVTLVGLASMLACKDRDKQQTDGSKAVASTPSPTQQSEGTPDADDVGEGEEGSAAPATCTYRTAGRYSCMTAMSWPTIRRRAG